MHWIFSQFPNLFAWRICFQFAIYTTRRKQNRLLLSHELSRRRRREIQRCVRRKSQFFLSPKLYHNVSHLIRSKRLHGFLFRFPSEVLTGSTLELNWTHNQSQRWKWATSEKKRRISTRWKIKKENFGTLSHWGSNRTCSRLWPLNTELRRATDDADRTTISNLNGNEKIAKLWRNSFDLNCWCLPSVACTSSARWSLFWPD